MDEISTGILIVTIGFLATEPWRWLGVMLSNGLSEESEAIKWIRAVSTALIASLVMRLVFVSPGNLAQVPLTDKIIVMIIALLIYLYYRSIIWAISAAIITLYLLNII